MRLHTLSNYQKIPIIITFLPCFEILFVIIIIPLSNFLSLRTIFTCPNHFLSNVLEGLESSTLNNYKCFVQFRDIEVNNTGKFLNSIILITASSQVNVSYLHDFIYVC